MPTTLDPPPTKALTVRELATAVVCLADDVRAMTHDVRVLTAVVAESVDAMDRLVAELRQQKEPENEERAAWGTKTRRAKHA